MEPNTNTYKSAERCRHGANCNSKNLPAGLRPAESDFALRAVQVALVNLVRVEHVLVLHPEAAVRHRGREIRQLAGIDQPGFIAQLIRFFNHLKVINPPPPPRAEPTYPVAAGAGRNPAGGQTLLP